MYADPSAFCSMPTSILMGLSSSHLRPSVRRPFSSISFFFSSNLFTTSEESLYLLCQVGQVRLLLYHVHSLHRLHDPVRRPIQHDKAVLTDADVAVRQVPYRLDHVSLLPYQPRDLRWRYLHELSAGDYA